MSTIAVYIPRVPIFVDKSQIENAFVDMFDDIKVNMDIHTKLDRYATEYQMMFAHLTTTEKTDMESFNTFNTRLKDEEEVWVYYYKDYKSQQVLKFDMQQLFDRDDKAAYWMDVSKQRTSTG